MSEDSREKHRMQNVIAHNPRIKPIIFGLMAGMALLLVYFGLLTFANSFSHALQQFKDMWYWIALLVAGFGTQAGLYVYIRGAFRIGAAATSSLTAAGGLSTTSMVACCAHHLTNVIPILSISAAAVFLTRFQTSFIVLGVLSNLIGINVMLKIIQQHHLYNEKGNEKGPFAALMRVNMKKALYFTIAFSALVFAVILFKNYSKI